MTLIEVIISALLVALIAIGTLTGLIITNKATGFERARAQATTIAQQNEERLRGEYIKTLSAIANGESITESVSESGLCVEKVSGGWHYMAKATLEATAACELTALAKEYAGTTYTGTVFSVKSSGGFYTPAKGTGSCETENNNSDVVKTTSEVTWGNPVTAAEKAEREVTQSSLVKLPTNYGLLVKVKNSKSEPVEGATVKVFSSATRQTELGHETTPSSGCVLFGDLQSTVFVTAEKPGWVNSESEPRSESEGAPLKEKTLSTSSLTSAEFSIEASGSIITEFDNTNKEPVSSFNFVAVSTEILNYGEIVGGSSETTSTAPELAHLFPLKEQAYTVYAGACSAENETTQAGGYEPVHVLANTVKRIKIELPKLIAKIYEGESASKPGSLLASASSAAIIMPKCQGKSQPPGTAVPYEYPVKVESGGLNQQYFPYTKESELCVDASSGGSYYKTLKSFANSTRSGQTIELYLKSGEKSSTAKAC